MATRIRVDGQLEDTIVTQPFDAAVVNLEAVMQHDKSFFVAMTPERERVCIAVSRLISITEVPDE